MSTDGSVLLRLSERLDRDAISWDLVRQEQIERGWGSTDTAKIPANWRDVIGPEKPPMSAEARARITEGIRKAREIRQKKQVAWKSNLVQNVLAKRRRKYGHPASV